MTKNVYNIEHILSIQLLYVDNVSIMTKNVNNIEHILSIQLRPLVSLKTI